MKRALTWIAILLMLAGILGIGTAICTNITFSSRGVTISEWEAAMSEQQTAADKVEKMVKSLRTTYDKWKVEDEQWASRGESLMFAAEQSAQAIGGGTGGAEAWNDAYGAWQAAVAEMNALDDPALDGAKKSVKSLNRTTKSVDGAMQDWAAYGDVILSVGVKQGSLFALCIAWRNMLLFGGIALLIVGVFVLPKVRETIAASHQLVGYLFVLPALLFLLVFVAYPIFYNIVLSFKDVDITNINFPDQQNFVGFKNYIALFNDVDHQMTGAIVNTLVFTIGSIFFQFIIGFLMALLFKEKFPLGGFVRGSIMISWLIPVTVSGLLFKFMFGMNGGIINQFLGVFGFAPVEWLYSVDYAMIAVIIANIWIGIPFNMILLLTGLTTIPADIYESCDIDGAKGLRRLFSITIPMIRPAIMSVLTLGFVYTFKVFDLVKVMTSGGPVNRTQLVSIYAYKLAFEKYEYSMGAAAGAIMFIILLIEGMFYIRAIREDEVM